MNQEGETDSCASQTTSSQSSNSKVSERTRTQWPHVRNECTPITFNIKPSGFASTVSSKFISDTTLYIRSSTLTVHHRSPHSPLLPSSAHNWNSLAAFLCHRTQPGNLSACKPHETQMSTSRWSGQKVVGCQSRDRTSDWYTSGGQNNRNTLQSNGTKVPDTDLKKLKTMLDWFNKCVWKDTLTWNQHIIIKDYERKKQKKPFAQH